MNSRLPALTRRTFLGLVGSGITTAALTANGTPALAAAGPDVVVTDDATTVTLSNGIISATLTKAGGTTNVLKLVGSTKGNENFNIFAAAHSNGYSTFNYSVGSTSFTNGIKNATYQLVSQSADRVEISLTTNDPSSLAFVVELHVVLERGMSGLYYYMIFRYPQEMPDGLNIGQLRYAFSAGDPSFTYFVVDDDRGIQQRPTIAEMASATTLQDTTYALPDGRIWTKYQNITNKEGDNHVFMISNGDLGLSLIQPSKEYFCGGPTKQELTCHDYYTGEILLWHPHTGHYGTPALIPEKGWEKIYGPFLLYVNESGNADPASAVAEMWRDAQHVTNREIRRWPYTWVSDPLYTANDRRRVTGQLKITDGSSPAHAWVVLAPPGEDWQLQSAEYVYAARACAQGRFTIDAVRPGTYTLSAFVDGVIGEYTRENVTVADHDLRLDHLIWQPRSHGTPLWQLGTASRSAEEFHVYGGHNGFRKYLTWLEYPYEFPNDVDFTIGVDDPATKWNFFQPCYRTPGTDTQLTWRGTTPDRTLTTWKLRFHSHRQLTGTATLDIALASSVFGSLRVTLNGTDLISLDTLPGVPGDNGSYRQTCGSMYRLLDPIQFPANLITSGENVITLTPTHAPKAPTADNWMEPMGGIMYDVIRLQVDRAHVS